MSSPNPYEIVTLIRGGRSVRDTVLGETFHPVVGPHEEAETLYARQMELPRRVEAATGEFIVWDVGLGAGANVLVVLRLLGELNLNRSVRVVSFDRTLGALEFALERKEELGYLHGFESAILELLSRGAATFQTGALQVRWELQVGDFPARLRSGIPLPAPDAILYDAFSPARNPEMWTLPLFREVNRHLDPARPCSLATYSRSTLLRTTLLLAGFWVGRGQATGEKEETTIAATHPDLLRSPLDMAWLERALRSTSAEPLDSGVYCQRPLSPASAALLRQHPQFGSPIPR